MKYMGSKRAMLTNGLGELLVEEIPKHRRFIDLFTGSAAVAWHVAHKFEIETHAYDLQLYGSTLAAAVLCRTHVLDAMVCWEKWKRRAGRRLAKLQPPEYKKLSVREVRHARRWCEDVSDSLVQAYGGHYFSPYQICWISALRSTLPTERVEHDACLAALVMASSKCAAAPGHTAQPFQPTPTAIKYLGQSWKRDLLADARSALMIVSALHAKVSGTASVGEANAVASTLGPKDLVFVDPPYSAVQYSRFYHVLEAIAAGTAAPVSGIGRYPPRTDRPTSAYSSRSGSLGALRDLLGKLARNEVTAVLTFPDHECSNGISGHSVREAAASDFHVIERSVPSVFSTLGGPAGDGEKRGARKPASELILLLRPR